MNHTIGIIGIGYGQHVLLPVFHAHPRSDVLALCASTQERAQEVAAEHNIPRAYGNWRDLIADNDINV
ncbi:MAG: Gfo/Idh/MocA family oxidoreductase, partial [Chloroflexota bacterium]